MENAFAAQLLTEPSHTALETFPDSLKMQLGPFNPQVQDSKTLSIHSLHASAFRLRYGSNYPRFPAHLIQHLQPQLFPGAVDQRSLHFPPGAFRPFSVPTTQSKLFPSAFAPPLKSDANGHDSIQEISPGTYVTSYYGSETDEDSNFRSNSERDVDFQTSDGKLEVTRSTSRCTPSPQGTLTKDEKSESIKGSDTVDVDSMESRSLKRGKMSMDPTNCPICGIMVLLGEAESHFFKELQKLSDISATNREKKYLYDKYHDVQSCFGSFGNSSVAEENGHIHHHHHTQHHSHGSETPGILRGRWETYQRIKSNRLGRLRIKNRKKKNGDPICPVCNEKIQGSVENINLHVEHCLKKHSDEVDEDEDENIDVEGDPEVYGEYEWTGRHLIRATTLLVGGFAAGLLSTPANTSNHQVPGEKDERVSATGDETPRRVTPGHLSDSETTGPDEEIGCDKMGYAKPQREKNSPGSETNFGKFQTNLKATGRA
ncbi:hypothetical protein RUM44_006263 [Polyplax serrata]|uniref:E3 ubiquitin-protein ligase RNF220 middle domain-containing protein n=1 Tax=Polyplax serrata TaxID=468196 RepID=A0ABR1AHN5_POLSC